MSGWDGILFPGERVLWQGQPDPRPDWSALKPGQTVMGLGVAAFAAFWMSLAVGTGGVAGVALSLFGLPFLILGVNMAGGPILWRAWTRRRTWYTLTDRRAFIATDILGRRTLDAYPIDGSAKIELEDGRHIWFATDVVTTKRGPRRRRIGFAHLREAGHVHALMRQVQSATT